MQKLLLFSSLRFLISGDLPPVLGKPFNQFKTAHVITASKGVTDLAYLERNRTFFRKEKWNVEELDIDGRHEDELHKILKDKELMYVEGGNTFYLLKSIRESGFEKVIKELLPQGLIYMGASAGSYVACPTIETSVWKSEHNRYGLTDFTAMNLVPFLLFVHYKSEDNELLKEKTSHASRPVRILGDEQAFLVKGDKVELLGSSPEIIF